MKNYGTGATDMTYFYFFQICYKHVRTAINFLNFHSLSYLPDFMQFEILHKHLSSCSLEKNNPKLLKLNITQTIKF